jgi:hypothetical protein
MAETRAAEFMMAGWGIVLLTTLICELAAALLYLYAGVRPASPQLRMLTSMFHVAAVVVGAISLAMIPALFKLRRQPPAPSVVTMALVIGGLPLAGLVLRLFL